MKRGSIIFNIDETIDAFRRVTLDLDCKRMELAQRKKDGENFEGQGYIRQSDDGSLMFKIYVVRHNAKPLAYIDAMFSGGAGNLFPEESFYDLEAQAHDGTRWTASRILIKPYLDDTFLPVLVCGKIQSMTAYLDLPEGQHYHRLHFFEEYDVPLTLTSQTEEHGFILDRAEFESCGARFEVRKRIGSGDTVIEATSEAALPPAFNLRIQEALQYITGKPAIWRARLQSEGGHLHLELASPQRKATRTQLKPPISPVSNGFRDHGWKLFGRYLSYVARTTDGTYWNPVAYHLFNACEATSGSVDAWAAGVSIAVEAIASLATVTDKHQNDDLLKLLQRRVLTWLADQSDLADVAERMKRQVSAMSNKRPDDALYALAKDGYVEKVYIKAWRRLRNRHLHPNLTDLKNPDTADYQKLLEDIHRVETLLRQLTFYLIEYDGVFTDYGVHGGQDFPSKQYPLSQTKLDGGVCG